MFRRSLGIKAWSCCWCLVVLLALGGMAGASAQESAQSGALQVVALLPQGQVQRLTRVVVRFDRDMVTLGTGRIPAEKALFRLRPALAGSYRWLDPRTLAFILDRPLTGAARVRVLVPAGARSLDGSRLAKAVHASIQTPPIQAVRWSPELGSRLEPRPLVRLTLNQAVRLESLARRTWFVVAGRRIAAKVAQAPPPRWERRRLRLARLYILSCPEELPPDQEVEVLVEPGVEPVGGELALQHPLRTYYRTYQELRLVQWSMEPSPLGGLDPSSSLTLEFNNPVDAAQVIKRLHFNPALEVPSPEEDGYPSRWVNLSLPFRPRTTYRVSLEAGLVDRYGTKLKKRSTWRLELGDLPPVMALPGGRGVMGVRPGHKAVLGLRLRNVPKLRLGLRWFSPQQAVAAFRAEEERPWDERPRPPAAGEPHTVVRELRPGLPPNQVTAYPLDLASLLGRSPRGGVLLVDVRSSWPDYKGRSRQRVRRLLLQATDLGLSLKLGHNSGLAWITSLSSGRPLAGVDLELRGRDNRLLWKGKSDASGLAHLPGLAELKPPPDPQRSWRNPVIYLLARRGEDFAILPASWGDALAYSLPYELDQRRPGDLPPFVAHALFQLPLYQPGQRVRFVVYLQKMLQEGLVVAAGQRLKLWVEDPQGRRLHEFNGDTNRYGSLAGGMKLSRKARLGRYSLVLEVGGKRLEAGGFRVASFRPPDFWVKVKAPRDWLAGDERRAEVTLTARYQFGTPVAGGRARLLARQEEADFAPARLKDYAVGDLALPGEEPVLKKELGVQKGKLDAAGRAEFKLPAGKPLPGHPVWVGLSAGVSDAAGMKVVGRTRVLVHPAAVYLGIKTPLLGRVGDSLAVTLAGATWDDKPVQGLKVRLTAWRQYWQISRERTPGGYFRYLGAVKRDEVWHTDLELGEDPSQVSFVPPKPGTYLLRVEARDAAGRLTRSACYLWVGGAGEASWQRFDDHRLELVADKDEVRAGENLRFLIKSPFRQATALITVEGLGVRRSLVRHLEGPAPVVELPLTSRDVPGVYVGVLLVRGRVDLPKGSGPDLGRPQVRIGYLPVKVRAKDSGLRVALRPEREQMRPGQEAAVEIEVTRGGDPAQAEVTLLAVDERVLSAAGHKNSFDPRPTFSRMLPLAVLSADMRTRMLSRLSSDEKGDGLDGEMGGGGLGAALRRRFHPAVFWLAQAETDEQGRLKARFKLPDTLTRYRVVAVAGDTAGHFGLGRCFITARLPLQILSALPRFATRGDIFMARVLVQNLGRRAGVVRLEARGRGLEMIGARRQWVSLAAGESKVVGFAVRAASLGRAALMVSAGLGEFRDAAEFSLQVMPPAPLMTAATAGALPAGKNYVLEMRLPADAEPHRGALLACLAPSLASSLARPVATLRDYPWDCLEQRTSKASASALVVAHGSELGLTPTAADHRRLAELGGLLWDYQTSSGGFAFWPGSQRSNIFLTAYLLVAANHWRGTGPRLPATMLKRALDYLERRLSHRSNRRRMRVYRRVAESLAIWALAAYGRDARPALEAALTKLEGLPPFALAALMQAAGIYRLDSALDRLVRRLEAAAEVNAATMHFTTVVSQGLKLVLGSTLRSNALALEALSRFRPRYPRLDALARWVALDLGRRRHLSTQDAVFGLWGLAAYLERGGGRPDLKLNFRVAGRSVVKHHFTSPGDPPLTVEVKRDLLPAGKPQRLDLEAEGKGTLFWSLRLSYAPSKSPRRPVNAGFALSRYFLASDARKDGWRLGDELEYVATVITRRTRLHVLVELPYPAGLEPVGAARGLLRGYAGPWHWREMRRSRLLAYAPVMPPGVYTLRMRLRAIAPGRFLVRPIKAEEMYSPEVFGMSTGEVMEIR